jgi:hypothetical protein
MGVRNFLMDPENKIAAPFDFESGNKINCVERNVIKTHAFLTAFWTGCREFVILPTIRSGSLLPVLS